MKRKLVSLLLVALLAVAALAPAALAATAGIVYLPESYTGLNVRKGPGINYAVAGWVVDGDLIDILSYGSSWSKIKVLRSGKIGYIKNCYFGSEDDDNPEEPSAPSVGSSYNVGRVSAKYASSWVNLRQGPGTGYASVGSAKSGTRLNLYKAEGNWWYVQTSGGLRGYISKNYVASGFTTTTSARVNLRETPNGDVIKTLSYGSTVIVSRVEGAWSRVKTGSLSGWVYNSYLR